MLAAYVGITSNLTLLGVLSLLATTRLRTCRLHVLGDMNCCRVFDLAVVQRVLVCIMGVVEWEATLSAHSLDEHEVRRSNINGRRRVGFRARHGVRDGLPTTVDERVTQLRRTPNHRLLRSLSLARHESSRSTRMSCHQERQIRKDHCGPHGSRLCLVVRRRVADQTVYAP